MLDFSMGWGSALAGHGRPEIADAVTKQVRRGGNFAYVTEQSLALGEELVRLSPACDAVRFCGSGTEATMYCLRLARAFTGRPKVLKFEGAYHGGHDVGVAACFRPRARFSAIDAVFGGRRAGAQQSSGCAVQRPRLRREIIERHRASWRASSSSRCNAACRRSRVPGGAREVTRECGMLAGLRRGGDRLSPGLRRRPGVLRRHARPGRLRQGAGRGAADRRLWRATRDLELCAKIVWARRAYVWMASTFGGNPVSTAARRRRWRFIAESYDPAPSAGRLLRQRLADALHDAASWASAGRRAAGSGGLYAHRASRLSVEPSCGSRLPLGG